MKILTNLELMNGGSLSLFNIDNTASNTVTLLKLTNWDNASAHAVTPHAPSNAQRNSDITTTEIQDKLTGVITTHTHDAAGISTGTLVTGRGGTGMSTYTTGSYIRASGTATLEQRTAAQVLEDIGAAPLAAPAFTGIPTAPTAAAGTNTTQIATTAFVTPHINATAAHGAVSTSTVNAIMLRDAFGRAQVTAPAVAADIARLDTVTAHTSLTNNPHVVTAAQVGALPIIGGNMTGAITRTIPAGTDLDIISTTMADNDFFRIRAGGASNAGYLEIATADDGSEPIHFRQYTGVFASAVRTATILDSMGNTALPGRLGVGTTVPDTSIHSTGQVKANTGFVVGSGAGTTGRFELTYDTGSRSMNFNFVL